MSTDGSQGCFSSSSLIDDQSLNEEQVMRYFARKYSQKELMKKYRAAARSQRSSIVSSSTLSSSSWDRSTASSGCIGSVSFSIDSSQSSQSPSRPVTDNQYHNHLPTSLELVGGAPLDNSNLTTPTVHGHLRENPDSSSLSVLTTSDFCACPFCAELGIDGGAKRPSDLRRHFKNFHNTNAGWICSNIGCELMFDWPAAYETHMREAHDGIHLPATEVMVQLHTQVVFACGFIKCKEIFDTPNDGDATSTAKTYFDHVAKHIKNSANISDWTYSTRIHNLLRQRLVKESWKEAVSKEARKRLIWQPHNSSVLRRKLECRDIGDVQTLFQIASVLGSPPYSEPNSPQFVFPGFTTPTLDGMVTAWQARSYAVSGGSAPLPFKSSMDSLSAANRQLPSSIAAALPHGNSSYSLSQEQYPITSLPGDPGWNLSSIESHTMNSPQNLSQQPAPQHVQVTVAQPLGYENYNPGYHGNMLSVPQHPLGQWSGSNSLGPYPSRDEVIADITNQTPGKRFLLKAKRSIETFRGRKNSATQGSGGEMNGNAPPMPTASPTRHNFIGLQLGYASGYSNYSSLNTPGAQLHDGRSRY